MADLIVIEELQAYLIAQGVAQAPNTAPSLTVPSVWTMTRDGAPLPRNTNGVITENATITLDDTLLRAPSDLEAWMQEAFVEVIVRARNAGTGKLLQRQILRLLVPFDAHGGKKQWMMGSLLVEQSTEWKGDQPLPQMRAIAQTDPHITFDRVASYRFACRRKILAGLTLP
jgi:hypothetical protein